MPASGQDPLANVRRGDLRILALADARLLPPEMQEAFDCWRIWRARDAVTDMVRRRVTDDYILQLFLERLEVADDEASIFEGIFALAESVDQNRSSLGLHSNYIVLIMATHLNPWGLLALQSNLERPAAPVVAAAQRMWELASEYRIDVIRLLQYVSDDPLLRALNLLYAGAQGT